MSEQVTPTPSERVAQARIRVEGGAYDLHHSITRAEFDARVDALIAAVTQEVEARCGAKHITADVVEAAYVEGWEDAESDPENQSAFRIPRGWKASRIYAQLAESP